MAVSEALLVDTVFEFLLLPSSSSFFFSPVSAKKNVGIDLLSLVSDFKENLPTDVI